MVLLTDPSSTVIGQLVSTAGTGQVKGQLGGVLVMGEIDSAEQIDLGVEVVTAGIELGGGVRSRYPKGLLIGQVVDVRRDANSVVQTAYLQPAANLDRLEVVLVITDYEGGLPPIVRAADRLHPGGGADRERGPGHAARRRAALSPADAGADRVAGRIAHRRAVAWTVLYPSPR